MDSINSLVADLKKYDDAYYNDQPLISDEQYDALRRKLVKLDPQNPYLVDVGASVRGGKIPLPYTMGSLDQIYEGDFEKWVSKYDLSKRQLVVTDKLDGTSALLVYRNEAFSIAYSRGNGVEGADISRHIRKLPSVPRTLPLAYVAIRGECIMKNSTFAAKYSAEYANPRNFVAGCMNRKETTADILSDIDFIAYEIVDIQFNEGEEIDVKTKIQSLEKLKAMGFKIPNYTIIGVPSAVKDIDLQVALKTARKESEYELDGIVITVDDSDGLVSKRTSSTLNPEFSVKYKVLDSDSIVTAKVVDVIYEVSKSGFYKPRVQIEPVKLFGTTVTYATGFNGKFIYDNEINAGATIRITKSGSVIPYIVEVLAPSVNGPKLPNDMNWKWNASGVEMTVSDMQSNPEVIFKQVLDFFNSIQIDQLKDSSLTKVFDELSLWGQGFEECVTTITSLIPVEWNNIIGANGKKIYDSMYSRFSALPLEVFLGSLPYLGFGFGVRKATSLLNQIDPNSLWGITADEIAALDGFDQKTAVPIAQGLPKAKVLFDTLVENGVLALSMAAPKVQSSLTGLTVVFTGFRDSTLSEKIERLGGKVGSSVSKKTNYLIVVDKSSLSTKSKKAQELGVEVLDIEEFKTTFASDLASV